MDALTVHQRRSEYMDAMIGEANATCNVIENGDEGRHDVLAQLAQLAGEYAQQRYEAFVTACNQLKANPPQETGVLTELGGEPV
jgi:hypothetical protein